MNPQPNSSMNPNEEPLYELNPVLYGMPMGNGQASSNPIPNQMMNTIRNNNVPSVPYYMYQTYNMPGFESLSQVQPSAQGQLQNNRAKIIAPTSYSSESFNPLQVKGEQTNANNFSNLGENAWQPEAILNPAQYYHWVGNWAQPQFRVNLSQLNNLINPIHAQAMPSIPTYSQPNVHIADNLLQFQTYQNQPGLRSMVQPPINQPTMNHPPNPPQLGHLNMPTISKIQTIQAKPNIQIPKLANTNRLQPKLRKGIHGESFIHLNSIRKPIQFVKDKRGKKLKKRVRLSKKDIEFLLKIFCPYVGCTLTFETVEEKREHMKSCQFKICH